MLLTCPAEVVDNPLQVAAGQPPRQHDAIGGGVILLHVHLQAPRNENATGGGVRGNGGCTGMAGEKHEYLDSIQSSVIAVRSGSKPLPANEVLNRL